MFLQSTTHLAWCFYSFSLFLEQFLWLPFCFPGLCCPPQDGEHKNFSKANKGFIIICCKCQENPFHFWFLILLLLRFSSWLVHEHIPGAKVKTLWRILWPPQENLTVLIIWGRFRKLHLDFFLILCKYIHPDRGWETKFWLQQKFSVASISSVKFHQHITYSISSNFCTLTSATTVWNSQSLPMYNPSEILSISIIMQNVKEWNLWISTQVIEPNEPEWLSRDSLLRPHLL